MSTTSVSKVSRRRARMLLVLVMVVLVLVGGVAFSGATPAQAAVPTGVPSYVAAKALTVAASKRGAPYRAGAVGPATFDCSGYTSWVYARVGKKLQRTAQQQYNAAIHVSRAQARKGDLVFFMSGGRTYHVGVLDGGNKVWHAPKPGGRVQLATIWTSQVKFGRVR